MTTVARKLATIKPGSLLAGVDLGLDSTCAARKRGASVAG